MKITFVYYDAIKPGHRTWRGMYNFGIASLSAVLKKEGFETSLIHIWQPVERREYERLIREEGPDIVAFSVTTNIFPNAREIAGWTKGVVDAPVVFGGVHAILDPESVLADSSIDAVCTGEGEWALLEFARCLSGNGRSGRYIKNMWIKEGGIVHRNDRYLIPDLDSLPFPDKEIFDYERIYREVERRGLFIASRGCPYTCAYCCNRSIREALGYTPGGYVRFKTVDYIIAEIKDEILRYPFVERIHFEDDILPIDRVWFGEFIETYRREIGLPFDCNLMPAMATKEIVDLLKRGGCDKVLIGIESGNDYVRREVMNRAVSTDKIREAFSLVREAGMVSYAFNMVGLPGEDAGMMLDTLKLNAEISPDQNQVMIFYPYPGTLLYRKCEEEGLLTERNLPSYEVDTVLNYGRSHRARIIFLRHYWSILQRVYERVFMLPGKASRIAVAVFDGLLTSRLTALALFPLMNKLMDFLYSSRITTSLGRLIKRRVFDRREF